MNNQGPQVISTQAAKHLMARMDMLEKQVQALLDGMRTQGEATAALVAAVDEIAARMDAPRTDVDLSAPNVIPIEGKVNG